MSTELILAEFPIVPISLSPALTTKLGELQVKAKTITAISDVESQAKGASVCRDMQTELKMMEKSRKKVTEPALAYQKTCKKVVDDASYPLLVELERIGKLDSAFIIQERKRVEADNERLRIEAERLQKELAEATRLAAQAKALAEAAEKAAKEKPVDATLTTPATSDVSDQAANLALLAQEQLEQKVAEAQAAANAPEPAVSRAQGSVLRKVVHYEIVDKLKVFSQWPNFFELKERASIINATLFDGMKIDGMKIWTTEETSYRSRS